MHSASQNKRSFFTSVRVSEFDTALYWASSCSFKKIKWPHQLCTQARTPNKKKNTSTLIWTEPFKRGYRAPYSVSLVSTLNNHFPPGNKTRCPRHSAEALKNTHIFLSDAGEPLAREHLSRSWYVCFSFCNFWLTDLAHSQEKFKGMFRVMSSRWGRLELNPPTHNPRCPKLGHM